MKTKITDKKIYFAFFSDIATMTNVLGDGFRYIITFSVI